MWCTILRLLVLPFHSFQISRQITHWPFENQWQRVIIATINIWSSWYRSLRIPSQLLHNINAFQTEKYASVKMPTCHWFRNRHNILCSDRYKVINNSIVKANVLFMKLKACKMYVEAESADGPPAVWHEDTKLQQAFSAVAHKHSLLTLTCVWQ